MRYFEVAPLNIIRSNTTVLTYEHSQPLVTGTVVTIPVGKRVVVGVVMKTTQKPAYATKSITSIVESKPLPSPLLKTAAWMSNYYSVHFATVLQSILPTGLTKKRRAKNIVPSKVERKRTSIVLSKGQRDALETIENTDQKTILLHGITGSGKTAVYIGAVKKAVAEGRSAIVLTPEISLTPQLVAEFSHHFEHIIVTHSQLTEATRHQQWLQALYANTPQIVIGPRSALFLPLQHVGIIIVDESHEPSYKQEQQPRYTTQRVARILATAHAAKLVLGTATPSVNEYYLAEKSGVIAKLPEKAKADLASQVRIVDATKRGNFSRNHLFFKSTY